MKTGECANCAISEAENTAASAQPGTNVGYRMDKFSVYNEGENSEVFFCVMRCYRSVDMAVKNQW